MWPAENKLARLFQVVPYRGKRKKFDEPDDDEQFEEWRKRGGYTNSSAFNVQQWLQNDTDKFNYIQRLNEYLLLKTGGLEYYHWITLWIQNSKPFHENLEMSERINGIILNAPQLEQEDTVFRVITNDEQNPSSNPLENDRLISCVYVSDDDLIKSWAIAWGSNRVFHRHAWNLKEDTTKCCLLKFNLREDVPRMYCVGDGLTGAQAEVILPKNCAFHQESSEEQQWDLKKIKDFHWHVEMDKYFESLKHKYGLRRDDMLHIKVRVVTYNVSYFQERRRTPPR